MSCECKRVLYKRVSEKPLQVKLLAFEAEDPEFEFQNQWPIVSLLLGFSIYTGAYICLFVWVHTRMCVINKALIWCC